MQPRLHRSHAGPYGSFLKTSGAAYPRVPKGSSAFSEGPTIFARPKSANLGIDFSVESLIITFSSLMSRCTIPKECKNCTATASY